MTTTPAPMGEPLSEADRLAEIRGRLADLDAKIKLRAKNAERGIVTPLGSAADRLHQYAPMDLEFLLSRVGVLEGQLATARALHQPVIGGIQIGRSVKQVMVCSTCSATQWPCADAVALGQNPTRTR